MTRPRPRRPLAPMADSSCRCRNRAWRPALRERNAARYPWLIATAQGFGPGWASAVREPGAADELTIRLVEEGPPIEGLIVGLEGRPVAEAQIKLRAVWLARDGKLSAWLEQSPGTRP